MKRHRTRRPGLTLAAVGIGLAAAFVLAETALRIADLPKQVRFGWRSRARWHNQLGFRGKRIRYSEDDFVVLLVGDSQVEAGDLPPEHLPEILLEGHLRQATKKNVRVFSLGASGYGQDQELLALQEYYREAGRADLVLLWETPYNDVWNNLFPNQWLEGSPPKPTFILRDGTLDAGTVSRIGGQMLSSVRTFAVLQKAFSPAYKAAVSDKKWERRYLPPAYEPVQDAASPSDLWQRLLDEDFGWMRYEDLDKEKSNFAIGLVPPSPRMRYALELSRLLLARIQELVEGRGGRFVAFRVLTKTSRLYQQPRHMEPRDYSFRGKVYRFSFGQELENIASMNKGIPFLEVPCTLYNWKLKRADWHLNGAATNDAMKNLARLLAEKELI